jgi:hypothetical protein
MDILVHLLDGPTAADHSSALPTTSPPGTLRRSLCPIPMARAKLRTSMKSNRRPRFGASPGAGHVGQSLAEIAAGSDLK